jgi:hypothetical protein
VTTRTIHDQPYAELASALVRIGSRDFTGDPSRDAGTAAERFIQGGWAETSTLRAMDIARLPAAQRATLEPALAELVRLLRTQGPESVRTAEDYAQFLESVYHKAVLSGERLLALRMAGASDGEVAATGAALADVLQNAILAGAIFDTARSAGVDTPDVGPAALAAVGAHRKGAMPGEVIHAHRLDGGRIGRNQHMSMSDRLLEVIVTARERVARVLESYSAISRERLLPRQDIQSQQAGPRSLPVASDPPSPPIDVRPLIAFASTATRGDELARVNGALSLYRAVLVAQWAKMALEKNTNANPRSLVLDAHTRIALVNEAIDGLKYLASVVRSEQAIHRVAEGRWKDIEREMQHLSRANPDSLVVPYVFPEEMSALECRALYIQDAVSKGAISLGMVHAELSDDRRLTFGPTETAYFSRLAFYAARKYAANFFADEDPFVAELADHDPVRTEELRRGLREVEVTLRVRRDLDAHELIDLGLKTLDVANRGGSLRFKGIDGLSSSAIARSIVERMALRIQASREVEYLTGVVAAYKGVPESVSREPEVLAHTRMLAQSSDPDTRLNLRPARNGQSLADLEKVSRNRWLRYRQQARAGVDVRPIDLAESDAPMGHRRENPMHIKDQRPFSRGMPSGRGGHGKPERGAGAWPKGR